MSQPGCPHRPPVTWFDGAVSATDHWNRVWTDRDPTLVTWHQPRPERSLELVTSVSAPTDSVVDVGGGASLLVDGLLDLGYTDLTVLDLSPAPLEVSRRRLGDRAEAVRWIVGDVVTTDLRRAVGRPVAVWHDRAVFHFLVDDADRAAYVDRVVETLADHGHVVIATFGPNGPGSCSGLPVRRSDAPALATVFGPGFELVRSETEQHVSPTGVVQEFVYAVLRRRPDGRPAAPLR